jgi:hypothetical protein
MVCPTRATIFMAKNDEGVKVNETALVRTRMPGGGGDSGDEPLPTRLAE